MMNPLARQKLFVRLPQGVYVFVGNSSEEVYPLARRVGKALGVVLLVPLLFPMAMLSLLLRFVGWCLISLGMSLTSKGKNGVMNPTLPLATSLGSSGEEIQGEHGPIK